MKNILRTKSLTDEAKNTLLKELEVLYLEFIKKRGTQQEVHSVLDAVPEDKCQFIASIARPHKYPVSLCLELLNVPKSSFYEWRKNGKKRKLKNIKFRESIRVICSDPSKAYSASEVLSELPNQLHQAKYKGSDAKVKKTMESLGIKIRMRTRPKAEESKMAKKDGIFKQVKVLSSWEWPIHEEYVWQIDGWEPDYALYQKTGISDSDLPEKVYLIIKNYEKSPFKPLECDTLFAEFADIPPNLESFAQWAKGHGLLGQRLLNGMSLFVKRNNAQEDNIELNIAESFDFWYQEHHELSCAVKVWELWRDDNKNKNKKAIDARNDQKSDKEKKKEKEDKAAALKAIISWTETVKQYKVHVILHGREDNFPFFVDKSKSIDIVSMASEYLWAKVCTKLKQHPLHVTFVKRGESDKLTTVLQPSNLLSAMWYQLLRAMSNEIRLRRCLECGKWRSLEGLRGDWERHDPCNDLYRARLRQNKKQLFSAS